MKRWHLAHWCAEVSTRLFSNLKSRQESTTDAVLDVKDNHASNRTIPGGYAFSLASIECLPTVNPPNAPMNQESRSAPSNLKPLVRTRETISAMVPPRGKQETRWKTSNTSTNPAGNTGISSSTDNKFPPIPTRSSTVSYYTSYK